MSAEQQSTSRLSQLIRAAASVASRTDLHDLFGATIEAGMELTGARYGALGVVGEHGALTQFEHRGLDEETVQRIGPVPRGVGVLGLITDETLRIDDVSRHPSAAGFPEHHPHMDTFLGVPLRAGDRTFGNLYLTNKPGGFTEMDQRLVEALAEIAGSAVKSIQLQDRLRRLAVVEDRERIAHDLHDAIIQELFAMGLELQATMLRTDDAAVRETLREHANRLDEVIRSLRELIFELRRPPVDRRDLRVEVDDLITRLGGARDIDIDVSYRGVFAGLGSSTMNDVLQLVREALSNALRHADAGHVTVAIDADETRIGIEVSDDGRGFDLATEEPGIGLSSMSARTERTGGSLSITTAPGKGTVVSMSVPI